MPRKRRENSGRIDPEVVKDLEKQTQKQREIENRRKKRKLIFWSIVIFGIVSITTITGAFLLLLGLVEW